MFRIKAISITVLFVLFYVGCEDPTMPADSNNTTNKNTLNDADLGQETGRLQDYFYNFDEEINANYLYYNSYITSGTNTINSPSGLNPYLDTLSFHTFPYYTVEVESQLDTIDYLLSLTPENVADYATLYPLDETNSDALNWCNDILVEYEGNCPDSVEVDFDYSILLSSVTGKSIDTIYSPASYSSLISKNKVSFDVGWYNIKSLNWSKEDNRYITNTDESANVMRATFCTGICDSALTNSTLSPCSDSLTAEIFTDINNDGTYQVGIDEFNIDKHDEDGSGDWTGCYDSTFVIENKIDTFDSLIYVGVIDTLRYKPDGLMLIDRTEWERYEVVYKSDDKPKYLDLDTLFTYEQIKVPDESPLFWINGDCNQNLVWDGKEVYGDWGADWCPDSLETGEGICEVVDTNGDGSLFDEGPCNCMGICSNSQFEVKRSCEDSGHEWTDWLDQGSNIVNPDWEIGSDIDPNGDNWRDCGWDGYCPEDENDTNGDENGTELNGEWDEFERFEENGKYDLDIVNGLSEYFIDRGNGVSNEPAEFCFMEAGGADDECDGNDPFEDRNCNGKWDDAEVGDEGNGVWDNDESFIDVDNSGVWEEGEPLHYISDRLGNFIVDYSDPANPEPFTEIDNNTAVTLFLGTYESPVYNTYNNFLEKIQIEEYHVEAFHDIEKKVTIYTNKIVEHPLPGVADDYHIAKTKWFQDIGATQFDENRLENPSYGDGYGYDYHLFKIAENGNIMKIIHPAFFYYYGYYNLFDEIELGSWRTENPQEEVYIYSYNGMLRAGEYYYKDTTIVTSVADYRVEDLYEVEFDPMVEVPFASVTYSIGSSGDTTCLKTAEPSWLVDPNVNIDIESNYMKNCPPVLDTLTNTFKITKTKTLTMIGSGLEYGLRNTFWLGSAGEDSPLGIVKDQLELRWSEPYWEEDGSGWEVKSRIELKSLRKSKPELSRIFNILDNSKHISIKDLGGMEEFENDPFVNSHSYGLHKLRLNK